VSQSRRTARADSTALSRPFGALAQRESEYLSLAGVDARYRELLRTIRMRLDGRTQACTDTVSSLAWWSGMSERSVQSGIKSLAERLGLICRERHPIRGGARGQTWTWTTTPLRYEDWPTDPLWRCIAATVEYVRVFYPVDEDAKSACSSPMSTQKAMDEHAKSARSARKTTRHSPERPPKVSPERDALTVALARDAGTDEEDAGRDLARSLGNYWVADREGTGLERFRDATAVSWLRERVPIALQAGCTETDLELAEERWAQIPFADPRNFLTWAIAERDDRLQRDRDRERAHEREEQRRRDDATFELERSLPGYEGRLAAVKAQFRGIAS
jgi:hypothetical protein